MKFPHGARVRCQIDGTEINDARILVDSYGVMYICQNLKDGTKTSDYKEKTSDRLGYRYSWVIDREWEEGVNNVHNLCLVEGPQVGDILVDRDGLKRKVLARLESLVFISVVDNYEKAGSFCTTQEIKSVGWKVESQPVPEPRVLTMNEIAEKFELPVDQIRVKKE